MPNNTLHPPLDPSRLTVCLIPFAISEERFLLIGTDAVGRILASYTFRGETVRLISTRRATASERSDYEKGIRF